MTNRTGNHAFARTRGLTLIELMLAMTITALIGAAIAGMLGAVSTGVGSRRDMRTLMLLANAAQTRLAAYVVPSRCVLDIDGGDLVLWLNDARESNTVHATEVRWLVFNQATGVIDVHFVSFPDTWTQMAQDLEDQELPASSNWSAVLASYQAKGWTASQTLIDSLQSVSILADNPSDQACRHLMYELQFTADSLTSPASVGATIRQHQEPVK